MTTASMDRRNFLKKTAATLGMSLAPSYLLLAQEEQAQLQLAPNERVRVAAVGIGYRGLSNIKSFVETGLCEIVALCDVDLLGEHTQEAQTTFPNARRFSDFRVMFDKSAKEFDAVIVSTPDHAHFAIAMHAMALGKHVYVEKPLAHTFQECSLLIEMAKRSKVVTQMGNQGHSGANYFQFKAWSEAGIIKDVTRIVAHMNGSRRWHKWGVGIDSYPAEPLPEGLEWEVWLSGKERNPYSERLHPGNWRGWFDYGTGAFGDWGAHLLDTAHRFLQLGLPEKISPVKLEGRSPLVFPMASTIQFSFPARKNMPACEVVWHDGVDNIPDLPPVEGESPLRFQQLEDPPREVLPPGKVIYGKDLVFQGNSHHQPLRIVPTDKFMEMRPILPRISGKNSNHYENFLLACLGEEEARSPFHVGGELTQVFNLGIICQRLGVELKFDPKKKEFVGNRDANKLLKSYPTKDWAEYYKL